jgi:HSP20 family protein
MNLMLRNRNLDLDGLAEMDRFQRELGRFFDIGFDNGGLFDRAFAPAVDLVEDADAYTLYADVPGVAKKDLELTIENNALTLRGEKKEKSDDRRFFRQETWTGSFRRTVALPQAADPDQVQAELKDGVLTVRIGKRAELKPRQIAVNVA